MFAGPVIIASTARTMAIAILGIAGREALTGLENSWQTVVRE